MQSTNQSNRRQLAFRNWPQVHREGSGGAEAQPNLQGHIEKDLYWDILLFLAPGHFSMINLEGLFLTRKSDFRVFGVNATSLHSSSLK